MCVDNHTSENINASKDYVDLALYQVRWSKLVRIYEQ